MKNSIICVCVLLTSDINHPYGYNINNQYNHKDINDNKLLKLLKKRKIVRFNSALQNLNLNKLKYIKPRQYMLVYV